MNLYLIGTFVKCGGKARGIDRYQYNGDIYETVVYGYAPAEGSDEVKQNGENFALWAKNDAEAWEKLRKASDFPVTSGKSYLSKCQVSPDRVREALAYAAERDALNAAEEEAKTPKVIEPTEGMEVMTVQAGTIELAEKLGHKEVARRSRIGYPCKFIGVTYSEVLVDSTDYWMDADGVSHEYPTQIISWGYCPVLQPTSI